MFIEFLRDRTERFDGLAIKTVSADKLAMPINERTRTALVYQA